MAVEDTLDRLARGETPPNVALMALLWDVDGPEAAEVAIRSAQGQAGTPDAAARLGAALALLRDHPEAFALIRDVLATDRPDTVTASPEAVISRYARAFDEAVAISPEASVALYSLGDPALLARITAEVVGRLRDWRLIGPHSRVLEVGCGAGRFLAALAPEVERVVGADISEAMVEAARSRTSSFSNVEVLGTAGRDLAFLPDGGVDLVLFADSFPYLVEAGGDVAARHFAESARVLAPGGRLLILNYSYRGDLDRDREEAGALAVASGLSPTRFSEGDFGLWDGVVFLFGRVG